MTNKKIENLKYKSIGGPINGNTINNSNAMMNRMRNDLIFNSVAFVTQ